MPYLLSPITSIFFAMTAITIGVKWPHKRSDGDSRRAWTLIVSGFFLLTVGEIFNTFIANAEAEAVSQLPAWICLFYELPRLVGAVLFFIAIVMLPKIFTLVMKQEK